MKTKIFSWRDNILKMLVVLMDLFLLNISYLLAFYIRFLGELPAFNFDSYIMTIPFVTLTAFIYIDILGLLKFYRKSRRSVFSGIGKLVFMQALTTTTIAYFLQGFSFPRLVLIISPVLQLILLTLWNWFMLACRDYFTPPSNAMLIGAPQQTEAVLGKFMHSGFHKRMRIKYVFTPEEKHKFIDYLGRVNEVILCSDLSEDLKMEILMACIHIRKVVYLVPEVFEISLFNSRIIHVDDMPVFMLDRLNLSFEQRFFKRAFDILVTLIALPLLSPIFIVVALLIKISSPGKVFYSQDRVTSGGKVYKIYKFRTMYEGAEAKTGPVLSSKGDLRVTKLGNFLRRYRIDELPQLINVLKGEMSLVGPRSERPFFVEQFNKNIDGYQLRNNVKAGLTGYAQIFGKYDTSPENKLKYDVLYIKNYSLLLDIKLILQTFNAILKKGSH